MTLKITQELEMPIIKLKRQLNPSKMKRRIKLSLWVLGPSSVPLRSIPSMVSE
jgi:hypothetical protein